MILKNDTICQEFVIYNPRWNDRMVLLADFKIGTHNAITFPSARTLPGTWYISGEKARMYGTEPFKTKSGRFMTMRVVPLDALEVLERERDIAQTAKNINFGEENA